jgi:enoyl-CoA hydratase/carnithine racemase
MSNAVVTERIDRAVVIRFNRPELRSPLSVDVLDELSRIVVGVENAEDVDIVVFTGAGDVFASGANLREIAEVGAEEAAEFAFRGQELMSRIAGLGALTIAAVNGICFGGALDLALACRRRIASPDSLFAHPGADLGIMTGWGGTQRLPRLVGQAIALEMFFTARRVAADEALRIGLVDEVVDDVVNRALDT